LKRRQFIETNEILFHIARAHRVVEEVIGSCKRCEHFLVNFWLHEICFCRIAAQTYLTFFANALGRTGLSIEDPAAVQEFLASGKAEMAAISMGAVLFGAATYIGNSPNFMIKAIAEQHKCRRRVLLASSQSFPFPSCCRHFSWFAG